MIKRITKPNMGGPIALLLFTVFTACALLVLLTGADIYRRLAGRDDQSYSRRTAAQYIATRVRQGDRMGGVYLRPFEGGDLLVLAEEIEGRAYETCIYCHQGYLRELFIPAGVEITPEDGEKVIKASGFKAGIEQGPAGRLRLEITSPDGGSETVFIRLRSGGEAKP